MYLKFGTDYERKNVTGTCHTDYVASQNVDIEYSEKVLFWELDLSPVKSLIALLVDIKRYCKIYM